MREEYTDKTSKVAYPENTMVVKPDWRKIYGMHRSSEFSSRQLSLFWLLCTIRVRQTREAEDDRQINSEPLERWNFNTHPSAQLIDQHYAKR